MTMDSVRSLVRRIVGRSEIAVCKPFLGQTDPISKERIAEMQDDIDSKLRKGINFTPAGPSGW
jgi:hypothetical protein